MGLYGEGTTEDKVRLPITNYQMDKVRAHYVLLAGLNDSCREGNSDSTCMLAGSCSRVKGQCLLEYFAGTN